jgi:hypothetical protein
VTSANVGRYHIGSAWQILFVASPEIMDKDQGVTVDGDSGEAA